MSVASRRAIYGKLSGDTTLTNQLGTAPTGYTKAIYYEVAPSGSGFPYVVFSKSAGTQSYAIGGRAYQAEIWMVKGVDRNTSADLVETIASRLDALLTDAALSISGATQRYLRRESDLDYAEVIDGVTYRHAGADFRLILN